VQCCTEGWLPLRRWCDSAMRLAGPRRRRPGQPGRTGRRRGSPGAAQNSQGFWPPPSHGHCAARAGRYVCMYDVEERLLLRRFQISANRSLDGVLDQLNSRTLTDAGPAALIDDPPSDDDAELLPASAAGALPHFRAQGFLHATHGAMLCMAKEATALSLAA